MSKKAKGRESEKEGEEREREINGRQQIRETSVRCWKQGKVSARKTRDTSTHVLQMQATASESDAM
jgi:hypothetical protein